jgi:hypothetical protein
MKFPLSLRPIDKEDTDLPINSHTNNSIENPCHVFQQPNHSSDQFVYMLYKGWRSYLTFNIEWNRINKQTYNANAISESWRLWRRWRKEWSIALVTKRTVSHSISDFQFCAHFLVVTAQKIRTTRFIYIARIAYTCARSTGSGGRGVSRKCQDSDNGRF